MKKSALFFTVHLVLYTQLAGCATLPLKKNECVGTFTFEQYFRNIDGSSTLIQKYTVIIEEQDDRLVAVYGAAGLESINGVICSAYIDKKSIKLVFNKFADASVMKNEVFTPGKLYLILEKKGALFHGIYISDKQKQGTYIFKKIK